MPTASPVESKAPPSALPHDYARTVGLDAWHVLHSIAALGTRRALDDDERTEQLTREQPHLKREERLAWIVEGGQERICEYLSMPERTLRRTLRDIERTWFPTGGYFAIWRKDRAKQRQEVNAYDLDELIARIEARLAHPTLPLEEAIRLAPGDLVQAPLPLEATESAAMNAAPPDVAAELAQRAEDGAGSAPEHSEALASAPAPDVASAPVKALTECRDRHEEHGHTKAKMVIREHRSTAIAASRRDRKTWERVPTAEEAIAAMALVMAYHPDELHQVLDDDATARPSSAPAPAEEGAPAAPALPRRPVFESTGQYDRQVSKNSDRDLLHGSTETTHARDRSAVVSQLAQDQNQIIKAALRIRQTVPTYWRQDALKVARRYGPSHIDLCLQYLDIERQKQRIDDPAKWLHRVIREASSSWLRGYLDEHDRKNAERQARLQRNTRQEEESGFDGKALRERLTALAGTVRASQLAERSPAFTEQAADRIEAVAATFGDEVSIDEVNRAEVELCQLDAEIAEALAEAFAEEIEQARAKTAEALRAYAGQMSAGALRESVRGQAMRSLCRELGVPYLATFYV